MARLKIHWATEIRGEGNAYGYTVQDTKCREAFLKAGGEIDKDADIALHVASGFYYTPVPDKFNVLYTNTEVYEISEHHQWAIKNCDAIITTAKWQIDAFRKYTDMSGQAGLPIYSCYLGVDVEAFSYIERDPEPYPFIFLWVGAPNARKGWEILMNAWAVFGGDKRFKLYLKTTMTEKYEERGNVIFDSRNLPLNELVRLYHLSHCFLFPSFGEGFGLTLAEAMATGLPCIYTPYTAMMELQSSVTGYPLKYKMIQTKDTGGNPLYHFAQADTDDLATKMVYIYKHYREAMKKGKLAAERIRDNFTWEHTGNNLMAILNDINERYLPLWKAQKTAAPMAAIQEIC